MNISDAGLALIREHEGLRLESYPDPATGADPWTVGYGHTGPDVSPGLTITADRADEFLRADVAKCEHCIGSLVTVPLDQGQFDALCSFVFNLGCNTLRNSTLLRLLNQGDYSGAQAQFSRWDHAGGKVLAGLTKRRAAEAEMFA